MPTNSQPTPRTPGQARPRPQQQARNRPVLHRPRHAVQDRPLLLLWRRGQGQPGQGETRAYVFVASLQRTAPAVTHGFSRSTRTHLPFSASSLHPATYPALGTTVCSVHRGRPSLRAGFTGTALAPLVAQVEVPFNMDCSHALSRITVNGKTINYSWGPYPRASPPVTTVKWIDLAE